MFPFEKQQQQRSKNFSSNQLFATSSGEDSSPLYKRLYTEEASNTAYNSLPPVHFGDSDPLIEGIGGVSLSKSCPAPNVSPILETPTNSGASPIAYQGKRKFFTPYWSDQAVEEAIEKGNAFRATFRVNGYKRFEAYCTVDGVPMDILINGVDAQNRAIEGDIVAITLDPVTYWTKLKGSNVPANSNSYTEAEEIEENSPETISSKSESSNEASRSLARSRVMAYINSSKRPTGKVVAILRKSTRRGAVIGFLSINELEKKKQILASDYVELLPKDTKFPKMVVRVGSLPGFVMEKLTNGNGTFDKELVAAQIEEWSDEYPFPKARILHILGRGGDIKSQIAAIMFENSICDSKFSPESLKCIPNLQWEIPERELGTRKDFRNKCTFTIDPSTATDLDDALSLEIISEDVVRIGVHVADVSYFVLPNAALDSEAQFRSTNVYIHQLRLSMLPPELSENLCSLLPGVDRLAFSVTWDITRSGRITNRWFGRSIIQSCCKLSYDFVQEIIEDSFVPDQCPKLHGRFEWHDVIGSLKRLYEISKCLRENRFKGGALWLDNSKLGFLFDEGGAPYDIYIHERKESCLLVEEFMLLANTSVAEVISMSYPDCALLRRHPEPNKQKLRDLTTFCNKHGFDFDTSSSGQFHLSLSQIRRKLKDDPVLFDIILSYASKPMQPAEYFCTGELIGKENDWAHYALAVPFYTHFTSPIRRYPDIIVHRTLSALLVAEEEYLTKRQLLRFINREEEIKCFSGISIDKDVVKSDESREVLNASAQKYKVPNCEVLSEVAAYCNERKLASRRAKEAVDKLYLWTLLKKKEVLVCEARVLGLGPRFMSVYINKFGIERRISYDEVEGLSVEWLVTTSTLVLDLRRTKKFQRKVYNGKKLRPIEDAVLLMYPFDDSEEEIKPAIFPLILQNLCTVSIALHAVGGDDGPMDIGVRLFGCSYFK